MRSRPAGPVCWIPGLVFIASLSVTLAYARQPKMCSENGSFYASQAYRVRKITFETPLSGHMPLGGMFGLESRLDSFFESVKSDLPLKENALFSNTAYSFSTFKVAEHFGKLRLQDRFRAAYPIPELRECDSDALMLDVVFRVYTTDYISSLSRNFDSKPDKISRALLPPAVERPSKILPAPFVGYNRSRGIFGGGRLSIGTPFKFGNGMDIAASASSSSAVAKLSLVGDHAFKSAGWLDHSEWRLGYRYFDLPIDTVRHKGGSLVGQGFLSTKPIGPQKAVLRFGVSAEGGHLQTELAEPPSAAAGALKTPYGAVKLYAGGTTRFGRQSLKASYGVQLGQVGKDLQLDYVKQIVDSAYSLRFLPRDHLPLRVDAQFSAGLINSLSGRIPVAERFYGGNVQREFIEGDNWLINSDPYIRSFPQGRLNRIGMQEAVGGTQFFSANFTAAQTVWKRPLVPEELIHEPMLSTDLKIKLRSQLENQRGELELTLLTETDEFHRIDQNLRDLDRTVVQIKAALNTAEMIALSGDSMLLRNEADGHADEAIDQIATYRDSKDPGSIISLVVPFDGTPSILEAFINANQALIASISDPAQALKMRLQSLTDELSDLRKTINDNYQAALSLLVITPEDVKPAQRRLIDASDSLEKLGSVLDNINVTLAAGGTSRSVLKDDVSNSILAKLKSVQAFVASAKESTKLAGSKDATDARRGLNLLAQGYEIAVARIAGVVQAVQSLKKPLRAVRLADDWKELERESVKLDKIRKEIRASLKMIRSTQPQTRTAEAVDYTGHVLDTIFRELNLVSASPVGMFDIAWLGPPVDRTYDAVRYGIGTGGRLSLLTIDITLGYSWNINPRLNEKRGAFIFSMNITDLFR